MSTTIKGNIGSLPIAIGAAEADTVILTRSKRFQVTAMSIHNIKTSERLIEVFVSVNANSSPEKRIAAYSIAANQSADIDEIIGQGFPENTFIIVVSKTPGALAGDLNCVRTFTEYASSS